MASRLKKGSAIAAACIAVVSTFEGLRTVAYRDPIGIPTVCFGETRGVKMGDRYTIAQCKDMLGDSLKEFEISMRACMKQPEQVPAAAYVAFLSFTYNVGTGAFCKSTLTRKLNSGDVVGACNELLKWDRAAGIQLHGLTKRRTAERALCLNGIPV
ncbi:MULTISPECIES: lysozyme [Rhizobium]|jgi:lysozyme|uniref:lysozyme n=1 Tax=Rhizobium TaxID=379 RepID=UPI001C91558D|nr:lysozyme [Rhizobium leguminosarum]MBY2944184.1 lysozyme [Rhizobium leguminosarum]